MIHSFSLLIMLINLNPAKSFFVEVPIDDYSRSYTHYRITLIGCRRTLLKYIIEMKNSTSEDDFFKTDVDGKNSFLHNINLLARYVGETQDNLRDKAYIHCNNDEIEIAHRSVMNCKRTLLKLKSDTEELRRKLGECLYTMQSFYSNTNWIEMFGDKLNVNFGNSTLMDVVDIADDTCIDVNQTDGSCPNNLLVVDKLTSGYHSGRSSVQKPARSLGSLKGKCSHGGPSDNSRKAIAKCGINKDSADAKYSPHHHLHQQAASAAIRATEYFFAAEGSGIIDLFGEKLIDVLFHIHAREKNSLAFAIDYTASMTDEMSAVKEYVIQLLTATMGSDREPADYILSMFHDPASYNYVKNYTDGQKMIQKVQEITTVQGENTDCEELTMAGILNAIKFIRPNSPLLVFSDAGAKDAHRQTEVVAAVKAKNVELHLFITNECVKRRNVNNRRRRSFDFFEHLAELTGGTMHRTDKQHIGNVLSETLEKLFPSAEVLVNYFRWSSNIGDQRQILVDATVSVLKIRIMGLALMEDVSLYGSNGILENFASNRATKIRTERGETIFSLQKPEPGIMIIKMNVKVDVTINITAQSTIKFEADIFHERNPGEMVRVKANPIAGTNYTIYASVDNLEGNGTLDMLYLELSNGTTILKETCTLRIQDMKVQCIVKICMPQLPFRLKIKGVDRKGYNFSRKIWTKITPRSVQLIVKSTNDEAVLNNDFAVQYEIIHFGNKAESYIVLIKSSNPSFLTGNLSRQHSLSEGLSANGIFRIKPTVASIIFSFTVQVYIKNIVQQSITKKLLVSDIGRPVCIVTKSTGWCDVSSLNTANCTKNTWNAQAEVSFSGTVLESIMSTGSSVKITYDNFTGIYEGPIKIFASGVCCDPFLQLTVIDVDDYITQCKLAFSNGDVIKSVEMIYISSDSRKPFSSVQVMAVVISASMFLVGVLIGVATCFLKNRMIQSYMFNSSGKAEVSKRPSFDKNRLQLIKR